MIFSKRLYLSPSIREDYRKHIRALKFNKPSFLLYAAVFLEGERALTLIHNSIFLNNYKDSNALIVGLALGRREGFKIIKDIVEDTYKSRHDFEYHSFFCDREER